MECNYQVNNFLELLTKGQSISKTIYGLLTSPKKRTDEFDLFAVNSKKQTKQICPFNFWEKLADHKLLSRLTDLKPEKLCKKPK